MREHFSKFPRGRHNPCHNLPNATGSDRGYGPSVTACDTAGYSDEPGGARTHDHWIKSDFDNDSQTDKNRTKKPIDHGLTCENTTACRVFPFQCHNLAPLPPKARFRPRFRSPAITSAYTCAGVR